MTDNRKRAKRDDPEPKEHVSKRRKGRPRYTCDPCNKSKVKCDEIYQRPCTRCIKRGKPEECVTTSTSSLAVVAKAQQEVEVKSSNPVSPVLSLSSSSSHLPIFEIPLPLPSQKLLLVPPVDLSDLVELAIQTFPWTDEQVKQLLIEKSAKWYTSLCFLEWH
jgi:hypothetical protein